MGTAFAVVTHPGWGWWWIFPFGWFLLIALFWLFVWRGPGWRRPPEGWHDARSPEAVLGERYARGEIDEHEYRARLAVLRERR